MSLLDYLVDSALVLVVLQQVKERPLTARTLVRPLVLMGVAVATYLRGFPTAGRDVLLAVVLGAAGAAIGVTSGITVRLRHAGDGGVLARAGLASAAFWVLGMGARFGFIVWITHGGAGWLERFSSQHGITGAEAWTVALLAEATCEVVGRTAVLAARRRVCSLARSDPAASVLV